MLYPALCLPCPLLRQLRELGLPITLPQLQHAMLTLVYYNLLHTLPRPDRPADAAQRMKAAAERWVHAPQRGALPCCARNAAACAQQREGSSAGRGRSGSKCER